MDDYIFLDFDETLGHTMVTGSLDIAMKTVDIESTNENQEVGCFQLSGESHAYVTFLRPGVREFLTWCASNVRGRVYVLTSAIGEYITHINESFKLGFSADHLIYREMIYPVNAEMIHNRFDGEGNFILVDNLFYSDHRDGFNNKISYLHGLPKENYIKVDDYYGAEDDDYFWEDLKMRIAERLLN